MLKPNPSSCRPSPTTGKILVLRNLIFGNVDTQYRLDNAIIGPVYLSATELDGFIGT